MAEPRAAAPPPTPGTPATPSGPEASPPATMLSLRRPGRQSEPLRDARTRLRRVLVTLAPWGLTLLVAMPFGVYYRATLQPAVAGAPPLLWGRPFVLWLLAFVPLLGGWLFHLAPRRAPALSFSRARELARSTEGAGPYFLRLPQALRLVAVALLVFALARPQHESADLVEVEGIDVVLALDVSLSMSDGDMKPDRITVAKDVLGRFIERRKSDRIGLVIFGREAFTQCPLTLDYRALSGLLAEVRLGLVDGRGTAIGNAVATALNRLRKSDARSKVVILLTDGDNNAGNVAPQQAARFAQALGVKIFTVLIGRDVNVDPEDPTTRPRYPVNPRLLEELAGATGGIPYLATDTAALEKRFQSILDELDRTRIKDQKGRPRELYGLFALPALALLLVEIALALTRFRRWP